MINWFTDSNIHVGQTTVTVTAYIPDELTSSALVDFIITVEKNCLVSVITPPVIDTQHYSIGDPAVHFQIPLFDNPDEEHCPVTYTWDYDILVLSSWTYRMEPRTLVWNSYSNVAGGTHPIGMVATNEAGVSARVDFDLVVDPSCETQTISAPAVTDQVYTVNEPAASYEIPEFTTNDQYCTMTYSYTSTSIKPFMTEISGRELQWETADNIDQGQYLVEIVAEGPDGVTASVSYTLTIKASCLQQVIEPSDTVDQTYKVN